MAITLSPCLEIRQDGLNALVNFRSESPSFTDQLSVGSNKTTGFSVVLRFDSRYLSGPGGFGGNIGGARQLGFIALEDGCDSAAHSSFEIVIRCKGDDLVALVAPAKRVAAHTKSREEEQ